MLRHLCLAFCLHKLHLTLQCLFLTPVVAPLGCQKSYWVGRRMLGTPVVGLRNYDKFSLPDQFLILKTSRGGISWLQKKSYRVGS
jgi:hypothetical protein